MSDKPSTAATVRDWVKVLRRVRFREPVKGVSETKVMDVARAVALYADWDGSNVFPGTARIAVDCRITYQVAKRAMRQLVGLGLIAHVGWHKGAKKYQLTIPDDLMEKVDVLSPTEYERLIENVKSENRRDTSKRTGDVATRTHRPNGRVRVTGSPVPVDGDTDEPVDNDNVRGTPSPVRAGLAPDQQPSEPAGTGDDITPQQTSTGDIVTEVRVTSSPPTDTDRPSSPTSHSGRELRTELAVSRARAPVDQSDSSLSGKEGCGGCEKGYVWPRNDDASIDERSPPRYCPTCNPEKAHAELDAA